MKVEFVACGDRYMASSRIRAWDLVEEWKDPNVTCHKLFRWTPNNPDIIVLQKVFLDHGTNQQPWAAEKLKLAYNSGVPLYWDLADPVWYWMKESNFRNIADRMKGIVVSSEGLRDRLKQEMGYDSVWIDDRFPTPKKDNIYILNSPPILVWFGYGRNRTVALNSCALTLTRLAANGIYFDLHLIDQAETRYKDERLASLMKIGTIEQIKWNYSTFWDELIDSDIALLPPQYFPLSNMKSQNKATLAKWAGLPVSDAQSYDELKRLIIDSTYRKVEGLKNRAWAEQYGHVRTSVEQWKEVINYSAEKQASKSELAYA